MFKISQVRLLNFAKYSIKFTLLICTPLAAARSLEFHSGGAPISLQTNIDQGNISIQLQANSDRICVEFPSLGGSIFLLKHRNGEFVLWESPIKGSDRARYVTLYEGESIGFSESISYLGARYELVSGETFRLMYSPTPSEQDCPMEEIFTDVIFP